jgi:hypothetical protein
MAALTQSRCLDFGANGEISLWRARLRIPAWVTTELLRRCCPQMTCSLHSVSARHDTPEFSVYPARQIIIGGYHGLLVGQLLWYLTYTIAAGTPQGTRDVSPLSKHCVDVIAVLRAGSCDCGNVPGVRLQDSGCSHHHRAHHVRLPSNCDGVPRLWFRVCVWMLVFALCLLHRFADGFTAFLCGAVSRAAVGSIPF